MILKALHRRGIVAGNQVAVCGFDGIKITEVTIPELTTIKQPIYDMGALISRLLIKKIEGNLKEDKLHELDVKLIVRDSTSRRESRNEKA